MGKLNWRSEKFEMIKFVECLGTSGPDALFYT